MKIENASKKLLAHRLIELEKPEDLALFSTCSDRKAVEILNIMPRK